LYVLYERYSNLQVHESTYISYLHVKILGCTCFIKKKKKTQRIHDELQGILLPYDKTGSKVFLCFKWFYSLFNLNEFYGLTAFLYENTQQKMTILTVPKASLKPEETVQVLGIKESLFYSNV